MFITKRLAIAGVALALAACSSRSPTVITGDTSYEMQSSIVMLSQNLSPERRDEFENAISTIVFAASDRRFSDDERLTPQARSQLKGRTVNQVIENAKLLRGSAAYY